jgi:hypothetical protein
MISYRKVFCNDGKLNGAKSRISFNHRISLDSMPSRKLCKKISLELKFSILHKLRYFIVGAGVTSSGLR